MTELKALDEYYYELEEALDERSCAFNGLEELGHLRLDEKTISQDPYLEVLNLKYGLFKPINLKAAFKLLNEIEDGIISYDPWKEMKTPIQAFVANQLSLFYLGYQGVTERDLEVSEGYLDDSIRLGNRRAMFARAEEIFNDVNAQAIVEMHNNRGELKDHDLELIYKSERKKLEHAIRLYEKAKDLGHKFVYTSLIECYKVLYNFGYCALYYDHLINKLAFDNYVDELVREYERMMKFDSCESHTYSFIEVLIKSKSEKAHSMLVKYSGLINEEMIDRIFECGYESENMIILNNLLLIFNSNNLLYQKYISKLLSAYSVYQNIKYIIHGK